MRPNIIIYFHLFYATPGDPVKFLFYYTFHRLDFYISSPFQSLLELHKRRKAVTEPEARYYMTQLLKGVQYLHNNRVIHRDLKLGNIFLNDDMEVKIGTFFSSLFVCK